jgi:hypothetical protein
MQAYEAALEFKDLPNHDDDNEDFISHLNFCRSDGMTWQEIADEIGVSIDRLNRWKKRNRYVDILRNVESYPKKL